jgi:hypothetical protein
VGVWDEGKTVRVVVPMLTPILSEDVELDLAGYGEGDGTSSLPVVVDDPSARPNWAYWVAGGAAAVGVAGLILGVTAHVRASDAATYSNKTCPERQTEGCSAREINAYEHYYSQQEHWNQRAQLGYGAAALGLVSGLAVLWLTGEPAQPERGPAVSFDWPRSGFGARLTSSF